MSLGLCLALIASGATLTFDEALELAARTPEALAERDALAAKQPLDRTISALSHNPSLMITPGYRSSAVGNDGFDGGFNASLSWSLAGLGGRRQRAAQAEDLVLSARARAAALTARLDAAFAWLELRASERELVVLAEEQALARALFDKTRRAVSAGVVLASEAAEAEAYLEEVVWLTIETEGVRFERHLALARTTARGAEELATAGADPAPQLPEPERWPALLARAGALPSAEAARLEALAAEARRAEAEAEGGWSLSTQVAGQREPPGDHVLWGGLGITPALFDRNQRGRALASAEAARAARGVATEARRAEYLLAFALHEVEHTRELEEHLAGILVPALTRAAELRERELEVGQSSVQPVLRAKREAAAARRRQVTQEASRRWAEVKAWLLLSQLEGRADAEGTPEGEPR